MVFDKEEWHIVRDTENRFGGGQIDTHVVVVPLRGPQTMVPIVPPMPLFDFLRNGVGAARRRTGVIACLTLAQVEDKRWEFRVTYYKRSEASKCLLPVDVVLWAYTSRPSWA